MATGCGVSLRSTASGQMLMMVRKKKVQAVAVEDETIQEARLANERPN